MLAVAACLVAVAATALALLVALPFHGANAAATRTVPSGFATIVRTDVVERQDVTGTLGFRGNFTVFNGARGGVITWLPRAGAIITRGRRLYELDDRPVPLFYGRRPAYRSFALGMSDGIDVRELKANLLAFGFDNAGRVTLDNHFDLATRGALKQWQRAAGRAATGTIPLGSIAFLPHAVRLTGPAPGVAVGATVQPGAAILAATDNQPAVLVALDPGGIARLSLGDRVLVTMPDNAAIPGRVASIGRVATATADNQGGGQGNPTPTIPVTVTLLREHRYALDQAPVQVAITIQEDRRVLAVPISALLARPGGGYAVQVERQSGPRLVPVTTGLFDDVAGRVEISGRGLAPGMRVEVPTG